MKQAVGEDSSGLAAESNGQSVGKCDGYDGFERRSDVLAAGSQRYRG